MCFRPAHANRHEVGIKKAPTRHRNTDSVPSGRRKRPPGGGWIYEGVGRPLGVVDAGVYGPELSFEERALVRHAGSRTDSRPGRGAA